MVNKGKKTEITTLKMSRKNTKGQKKVRKNILVRSEKIWKKVPKVRKTAFWTSQKKLETQPGSYAYLESNVYYSF